MKKIDYRQSALLSTIILFLEYLLIRYALFDLHKMKDWPTVLFIGCFVVLVICFFLKIKITSLIVSMSYIIGFVIGYLFQTNGFDTGGGGTNNLWLIWTITILIFIFLSMALELIFSKKTVN